MKVLSTTLFAFKIDCHLLLSSFDQLTASLVKTKKRKKEVLISLKEIAPKSIL